MQIQTREEIKICDNCGRELVYPGWDVSIKLGIQEYDLCRGCFSTSELYKMEKRTGVMYILENAPWNNGNKIKPTYPNGKKEKIW